MGDSVLGKRFTATADVLCQSVEDEMVLLDLKSQRYYGLDDVGARIWQLLQESGSPEEVANQICKEYDGDQKQILGDVEGMIQDFLEQGLIVQNTGNVVATSRL